MIGAGICLQGHGIILIQPMDWLNRMTKISNKFKFQLFGRTVDDLERCYESASKLDSDRAGRMSQYTFNQFLNSFGVFLSTQELRAISDHYKETDLGKINYVDFIEFIRKDITEKRVAAVQHAFEQLSPDGETIGLQELILDFRPEMHPHNRTRTKEARILEKQFREAITRRSSDGKTITREEFFEYFYDVNACIPHQRQQYFIDILMHGFGIDQFVVSPERIRQVELTSYEKIRDKTYVKQDEGLTSKAAFRYFDLEDKGVIDYSRFANGLQRLGCSFRKAEMKAVYYKHTGGEKLMTYEMFCAMMLLMGSGVKENPNPVFELARQSKGVTNSNGMTKRTFK